MHGRKTEDHVLIKVSIIRTLGDQYAVNYEASNANDKVDLHLLVPSKEVPLYINHTLREPKGVLETVCFF